MENVDIVAWTSNKSRAQWVKNIRRILYFQYLIPKVIYVILHASEWDHLMFSPEKCLQKAETLKSLLHHSPAFEESHVENGGVGVDKLEQESLENQTLLEVLVSLWYLWNQWDTDEKH